MIALVKALHIAGLVLWCASLLTLPLLLGLHRQLAASPNATQLQHNYTRFRRLTHFTYTALATPAAIVAIAAGTVLIFGAQVFEMWLLAKLACVAGMVLAHAWLGHLIVQSGEKEVHWRMPAPTLSLLLAVPCMLGVLWLVLLKPDLGQLANAVPDWLQAPRDKELKALVQQVLGWVGLALPQEVLP
jgi:protoporphyrinogen IX oxidase